MTFHGLTAMKPQAIVPRPTNTVAALYRSQHADHGHTMPSDSVQRSKSPNPDIVGAPSGMLIIVHSMHLLCEVCGCMSVHKRACRYEHTFASARVHPCVLARTRAHNTAILAPQSVLFIQSDLTGRVADLSGTQSGAAPRGGASDWQTPVKSSIMAFKPPEKCAEASDHRTCHKIG